MADQTINETKMVLILMIIITYFNKKLKIYSFLIVKRQKNNMYNSCVLNFFLFR